MHPSTPTLPRLPRRFARAAVLPAALALVAVAPAAADAGVLAVFDPGAQRLTVVGDGLANELTVGRTAAGAIRVNGGAVAILGGTPTVANTTTIEALGQFGDDSLVLDQSVGALPRALLFGGAGHDRLTGGSGDDQLFGQAGDDQLSGEGGRDGLLGGDGHDTVDGGPGDDTAALGAGDDRFRWGAGDNSDAVDAQGGSDALEFTGAEGDERVSVSTVGTRVHVLRDIGSVKVDVSEFEQVTVDTLDGADTIDARGFLPGAARFAAAAGGGDDTVLGSLGRDLLIGGSGNDRVSGGNDEDVTFLGEGHDVFTFKPGDDSGPVHGQDGTDRIVVNGSNASERIGISASRGRVRLHRDVGAVAMDLDDVEAIDVAVFGGADTVHVGDLSDTGVEEVRPLLGATATGTAADAHADLVRVDGTPSTDRIAITGLGGAATVGGLPARTSLSGASALDALEVRGLAGTDTFDATGLLSGAFVPSFVQ